MQLGPVNTGKSLS